MLQVLVLHLCLGAVASFLGTLPFGPINLSVVNVTLKQGLKTALHFSFAAALVEIIYSLSALHFGRLVSHTLEDYPIIQFTIIILFVIIGAFLFFKENNPNPQEKPSKRSIYLQGVLIALLNLQAIPFWIFILALYDVNHLLDYGVLSIFLLVMGAMTGKFLALALYAFLSVYISRRVNKLTLWMNKILGAVFILVGITAFIRYFWR